MAPDAGFEPATKRLTAAYSTAELIRIKVKKTKTLSQWLRMLDSNQRPSG